MDIITREKAICMLYCEPYNKDRAREIINGIEKLVLMFATETIQQNLFCTHLYISFTHISLLYLVIFLYAMLAFFCMVS